LCPSACYLLGVLEHAQWQRWSHQGFARAYSASPGFSRSPRGAEGLGEPAELDSLGWTSGELLSRTGLSPALRLLGRCWSAASGCSTWRAERSAGNPRGRATVRAGGADCGRMLAGLALGDVAPARSGARSQPLASPLTCHLVVSGLRGSLYFWVVGGGGVGS
jgi:hypothetical protein